jgi:hypothetical protein
MGNKMATPTGSAGGDLGGNYPNPTVVQTHLNNGTVTTPSLTFASDTNLGFYRIGADQLGLSVGANGKGAEFGNFSVNNIAPIPYGPNTVRYTNSFFAQPAAGAVETTAIYIKMNHSVDQMSYGIYGEIDAAQNHVGGSFTRVTHLGAGDAHYVAQFGTGGCIGYEAASWVDGSTGFLADVQIAGLPNTVLFNALWQQATIPNYGLFVATDSPGHSLTISKLAGANEGQVQIRITEPSYSSNRYEVYNSGQVNQIGPKSTSLSTANSSPELRLVATYWDDTQSVDHHAVIGHQMLNDSPSSALYVKIGPYASEQTVCMLSPGQVDLQTSQVIACGGLTMKAGGANVDMQTGQVVACGGISMKAGGADVDMQTGSVVTCGGITMKAGGGNIDLQAGSVVGASGLSMKAGGGNLDLQGGVVVNCNSIQTTSAMTFAANGFTVAQFSYDSVNATGQVNLNIATTNVATAGSATLPSNPLGFMIMMLNGNFVKVPYYNV